MADSDEKIFIARITDMAENAERRGAVYTHFLNERQQHLAESVLKKEYVENYCFFGGAENCERRILCVFSEYCRPENSEFPLSCITFRYKPSYNLSHRDFLGALMSLNIKREAVGDILTGEGAAQIFVIESVKNTILDEIRKIGSTGVDVTSDEPLFLDKTLSFREINGTVSSMRLDCVLSLALRISRSKAASLISAGAAEVNFCPADDTSFVMKQGDTFSVRKHGKFRIEEISGVSKKGRIHISVLKYC